MAEIEFKYESSVSMPTPRQLKKLAAKSILFAQRHNKLSIADDKQLQRKQFQVKPTLSIERPDIMDHAPFGFLYHRTISAIINQSYSNEWSMRYANGLMIEELGSDKPGIRDTYSFEWDEEEVKRSERQLVITPARENYYDVADAVDNFKVDEYTASMWNAQVEFESVTRGDVNMLIRDLELRINAVETGGLQYRETRKNYLDYYNE